MGDLQKISDFSRFWKIWKMIGDDEKFGNFRRFERNWEIMGELRDIDRSLQI